MSSERSSDDHHIYHRTIEPTSEGANSDIVELVADIEQCEIEDLPPFWARIDDVVTDVFSDPPAPEAQIRLQFTYAGYRIALDQSGEVELMKVAGDPSTGPG